MAVPMEYSRGVQLVINPVHFLKTPPPDAAPPDVVEEPLPQPREGKGDRKAWLAVFPSSIPACHTGPKSLPALLLSKPRR
jgi:hypothetical protein